MTKTAKGRHRSVQDNESIDQYFRGVTFLDRTTGWYHRAPPEIKEAAC